MTVLWGMMRGGSAGHTPPRGVSRVPLTCGHSYQRERWDGQREANERSRGRDAVCIGFSLSTLDKAPSRALLFSRRWVPPKLGDASEVHKLRGCRIFVYRIPRKRCFCALESKTRALFVSGVAATVMMCSFHMCFGRKYMQPTAESSSDYHCNNVCIAVFQVAVFHLAVRGSVGRTGQRWSHVVGPCAWPDGLRHEHRLGSGSLTCICQPRV
jgi:hypothetical protein